MKRKTGHMRRNLRAPTGSSPSARKRRTRASCLSRLWHLGDPDAGFRLFQRWRALRGIAVAGPDAITERLRKANAARKRYRDEREREAARRKALRPFVESSVTIRNLGNGAS
jgi:hypothetical protein